MKYGLSMTKPWLKLDILITTSQILLFLKVFSILIELIKISIQALKAINNSTKLTICCLKINLLVQELNISSSTVTNILNFNR